MRSRGRGSVWGVLLSNGNPLHCTCCSHRCLWESTSMESLQISLLKLEIKDLCIYSGLDCPLESAYYSFSLKKTKHCFVSSLPFMQKHALMESSSFCWVSIDMWRLGFADCIDILHQPLQLGLLKIAVEIIQ